MSEDGLPAPRSPAATSEWRAAASSASPNATAPSTSVSASVMNRRRFLTGLAGTSLLLARQRAFALGELSKLRLLRLRLPDLPDPRPTALRRLAWELERRTSLVTVPDPIELPLGSPELFRYPLALLSGNRAFAMPSEADVVCLRRYLTFGGCLLVDSAEGRAGGAFDASVRKLLARALPGDFVKRVPDDHVVWKSFYVLRDGAGRVQASPAVEGIERDRRLVVIYTQNDLCGAMARDGFGRWEHDVVPGGDEQRERSFRFAVNLVMYALCLDYKTEQAHIDFIMRTRRSRP
jgi:hypothetical protein